jgi:hypothetical protein
MLELQGLKSRRKFTLLEFTKNLNLIFEASRQGVFEGADFLWKLHLREPQDLKKMSMWRST